VVPGHSHWNGSNFIVKNLFFVLPWESVIHSKETSWCTWRSLYICEDPSYLNRWILSSYTYSWRVVQGFYASPYTYILHPVISVSYSTFQFHYNVHPMLYDEWSPNIGYAHTIVEPGGTWLVPCPRPRFLGPPPLEGLTQQLFVFQSGIKCWVVPKEWEVLEVSACPPRDAYLWNFPRSMGVTSWKKWHNLFWNFKLQWAFWGKKKCLLQYAFHFSKQALLAHNLLHFGSFRVYLQIH